MTEFQDKKSYDEILAENIMLKTKYNELMQQNKNLEKLIRLRQSALFKLLKPKI